MRGDDNQQEGMFSYISPEKRVPEDHPLRAVRKMVDEILKEMSPKFAKLYSDVGRVQQTLPILAVHRVIPYRLVHLHPHKPSEQQVVLQLLDQHALTAYRIENLQQQRPKQSLRRNRWARGDRGVVFPTSAGTCQAVHVG